MDKSVRPILVTIAALLLIGLTLAIAALAQPSAEERDRAACIDVAKTYHPNDTGALARCY